MQWNASPLKPYAVCRVFAGLYAELAIVTLLTALTELRNFMFVTIQFSVCAILICASILLEQKSDSLFS